jgi:hypothetical protein
MRKFFYLFLFCIFILTACMPARVRDKQGSSKNIDLKCNIYVVEAMKKKGITLPLLSANDLDNYLKSSPKWTIIPKKRGRLDHAQAYKKARGGKNVLVTYNTQSSASGHIAVVKGNKRLIWSGSFGAHVPYVWGSVGGKRPKEMPLSKQFGGGKEKNMNYYVYTK